MRLRNERRFVSSLAWTVCTCGVLLIAGARPASAAFVGPELDPGSAANGIALAVGAALLIVERYRSRR
jgi:hypothetical protein